MADFESIKLAVRAAEECATWAANAADTIDSVTPDGESAPAWVYFHRRTVDDLVASIDAVVVAFNRASL